MAFGKNFLCASMIYLPSSILEIVDGAERKIFHDYVDSIFIIERNGDNYFLDENNKFCSIHILQKKALLDENIFLLLSYREEHPKASFDYIFKKYKEQMEGYMYFSRWLFENASTYIKDLSKDAKQGFELQYTAFMAHGKELKAQFPMDVKEMKVPDMESIRIKTTDPIAGMMTNTDLRKFVETIPEQMKNANRKKDRIKSSGQK